MCECDHEHGEMCVGVYRRPGVVSEWEWWGDNYVGVGGDVSGVRVWRCVSVRVGRCVSVGGGDVWRKWATVVWGPD